MFQDETLTCRDCGRQFVFTAGEQEFYQSRGLMNKPGRCPECRSARKQSRGDSGGYAYSTGGGNGGSYSGGGGGGYGGGYDRPRREMFPAVCSACGKETKVPFQPRGDKPVYCSECFESVRGGSYR
ncbi:MAG TPA: zinc-ribbon domain containing protein [Chloroflexota bacterium]